LLGKEIFEMATNLVENPNSIKLKHLGTSPKITPGAGTDGSILSVI